MPVRQEQVAYAQRRGLSQRRSCTLLEVARSALGYRKTKAIEDGGLEYIAMLSAQYQRYGYRHIRIFFSRDGHAMSPGRAHRGSANGQELKCLTVNDE